MVMVIIMVQTVVDVIVLLVAIPLVVINAAPMAIRSFFTYSID